MKRWNRDTMGEGSGGDAKRSTKRKKAKRHRDVMGKKKQCGKWWRLGGNGTPDKVENTDDKKTVPYKRWGKK